MARLLTGGTTHMATISGSNAAAPPGACGRTAENSSAARPLAHENWATLNTALVGRTRSTAWESSLAAAVTRTTPMPGRANTTGVRAASNRSRASSSSR